MSRAKRLRRLRNDAKDIVRKYVCKFTNFDRVAIDSKIRPTVSVVPYLSSPNANFLLEDLEWPFGKPAFVTERAKIFDLRYVDHVLTTPSPQLFDSGLRGISAKISLMIIEPRAVCSDSYNFAHNMQDKFHKIFSHDRTLVDLLRNGIHLEHGRLEPLSKNLVKQLPKKIKRISLIASEKKWLKGHRLRHEIVDMAKAASVTDLDAIGRGYKPIDETSVGYAPYLFSVVIENSRQPGYFSEKIIDAFLHMALPIYWGDPNIEQVFDNRGMIVCTNAEEIVSQIIRANDELYTECLPYLKLNRHRALDFVDYTKRAARLIVESDQMVSSY